MRSLIPTLIHKIAEQAVPDPPTDTRSLTTYQQLPGLMNKEFLTLKNIEQAAGRAEYRFGTRAVCSSGSTT